MRISTSQYYSSNVQTMDNQQAQLSQLQQELSSGNALSTPADNPLGAAQAVTLSMQSSTLAQYTTNQNSALTSLQLESTTLSSVTSVMQSITSLMVQANDHSLSDSNRSSIATELQGDRNQLLTLANTTDGTGSYIFSGFQSATQPFTDNAGGGVTYHGDTGQRLVQVSGTRQIVSNDSGSSVFMSVASIGASPVLAGSSSNTGTGRSGAVTITNPAATTNTDSYSITFGGTAAAPTYTVTDNTIGASSAVTTSYTAGTTALTINLGTGMTASISGTPAVGDSFSVTPGTATANSNVFTTLDSIIAALQVPVSNNPTAYATQQNALTAGTTAFQNSLTNISMVQASVGGRTQELNALQTATSNNSLQLQSNLSNITSVDMVSTISQYEEVQNALQAAQKSFVQIQGMSLFQYINP
ncbi:flagellar hook-associated protein 3 [Trinickia violacea]|uniref:Flagellar hook-associated protein 3 n=1 Tax=Trinickia violacea TaxID=2571746 RepID=A0A4P8IGL3_9BURK|nr:flagellar hook-associated protein FlgL [Trinickia violacea]QCP47802.1 flagellar hook-associated protein 3 [Trinickia violacea]